MVEAAAPEPTSSKHLEPSELGTQSYWDAYYQHDIENAEEDEDEDDLDQLPELESWFDDVGAPAKILQYLTSDKFPLSASRDRCTVLDLGTGNGSALFDLRTEGGYTGPLVGIDYSPHSIELAERLKSRYSAVLATEAHTQSAITFEVFDLITGEPNQTSWWPRDSDGFDLVLDKGTFDAISLSSEQVRDPDGTYKRLCEVCPPKTAALVKPGGFFLITTCNWTEDEIVEWFTQEDLSGVFEVFDRIKYKSFQFGGQQGQGVATVCFRKIP